MVECPEGLQPLLDGDLIRYEIGYAAEAGWKHKTGDEDSLPPFSYVEEMLLQRLANLKGVLKTELEPRIYLTEGRTFRFDVAKRKPYKGTRQEKKPYHFKNLSVYLKDVLGATVVTGIEADDALAIEHSKCLSEGYVGPTTVLCSRDKDLRQCQGWFYSWELGKQPSYGPTYITQDGSLELSEDRTKLTGSGLAWLYAQILIGDTVDNIPGCPGIGPVAAHLLLSDGDQLTSVKAAYKLKYGEKWEAELTEQGRLCWLLRRPDEHWKIGVIE